MEERSTDVQDLTGELKPSSSQPPPPDSPRHATKTQRTGIGRVFDVVGKTVGKVVTTISAGRLLCGRWVWQRQMMMKGMWGVRGRLRGMSLMTRWAWACLSRAYCAAGVLRAR